MRRPLIAEKSEGLAGKPTPTPSWRVSLDASSLEFLFFVEPDLSSKKLSKEREIKTHKLINIKSSKRLQKVLRKFEVNINIVSSFLDSF